MAESPLSVLIVDDDREIREALSEYFEGAGWRAATASSGREALARVEADPPHTVVSDMRMPGMSGLELHRELVALPFEVAVVMVTAHGDIPMAIEAMRAGVDDFIEKPFDPERVLDAATRAAETLRLRRQNERLRGQLGRLAGLGAVLVGESVQMRKLRQDIAEVAEIDASVLILGETGTGKELVARALHDMSPRAGEAFVPVNCAAVPEGLFESTMFGHLKGAFTGAVTAGVGAFKAADSGSLFLDEIGACPVEQQAKLLRVLEAGEVAAVGASAPSPVDARIVSATNADLRANITAGSFRDDLYYRISTITLQLPPLRERGDDIVLLFSAQLQRFAKVYDVEPPELSQEDVALLQSHSWPGNVRELRQVAERRMLDARHRRGSVRDALGRAPAQPLDGSSLKEQLEAYERAVLAEALTRIGGTMDEVAQELGIARRTLNEKLAKYGLSR